MCNTQYTCITFFKSKWDTVATCCVDKGLFKRSLAASAPRNERRGLLRNVIVLPKKVEADEGNERDERRKNKGNKRPGRHILNLRVALAKVILSVERNEEAEADDKRTPQ